MGRARGRRRIGARRDWMTSCVSGRRKVNLEKRCGLEWRWEFHEMRWLEMRGILIYDGGLSMVTKFPRKLSELF